MSSLEAMDEVDRHFFKGGQNRTILRGGQAAYGAWKLVEGIPIAWRDSTRCGTQARDRKEHGLGRAYRFDTPNVHQQQDLTSSHCAALLS